MGHMRAQRLRTTERMMVFDVVKGSPAMEDASQGNPGAGIYRGKVQMAADRTHGVNKQKGMNVPGEEHGPL